MHGRVRGHRRARVVRADVRADADADASRRRDGAVRAAHSLSVEPTANRAFCGGDSSWLDDESRSRSSYARAVSGYSEYDGVDCLLEPTTTNGVTRIWIPSATSWTKIYPTRPCAGSTTWLQRDAWCHAAHDELQIDYVAVDGCGLLVPVPSSLPWILHGNDDREAHDVSRPETSGIRQHDFYKDVWFTQTFTLVDDALSRRSSTTTARM